MTLSPFPFMFFLKNAQFHRVRIFTDIYGENGFFATPYSSVSLRIHPYPAKHFAVDFPKKVFLPKRHYL